MGSLGAALIPDAGLREFDSEFDPENNTAYYAQGKIVKRIEGRQLSPFRKAPYLPLAYHGC